MVCVSLYMCKPKSVGGAKKGVRVSAIPCSETLVPVVNSNLPVVSGLDFAKYICSRSYPVPPSSHVFYCIITQRCSELLIHVL